MSMVFNMTYVFTLLSHAEPVKNLSV